jgi:hypothetical protein
LVNFEHFHWECNPTNCPGPVKPEPAPKRYVWKAEGRDILIKINKARAAAGLAQYIV